VDLYHEIHGAGRPLVVSMITAALDDSGAGQ
jgi:hypothetical protein